MPSPPSTPAPAPCIPQNCSSAAPKTPPAHTTAASSHPATPPQSPKAPDSPAFPHQNATSPPARPPSSRPTLSQTVPNQFTLQLTHKTFPTISSPSPQAPGPSPL